MSAAPRDRQPWPMKWIVLAILALVVPYTLLTLHYRKPGRAFEPYEDLKNRANVSRLLAAGYRRIPLVAQRPADGQRAVGGATIAAAPGGIPADLRSTLVEPPLLAAEIANVAAAPSAGALLPYSIHLACTLPDEKWQLAGAELYSQGAQIVVVPTFERIGGGLHSRSSTDSVLLTIPGGTLQPGSYTVTLVAERASRTWSLEVK
jgi:hypothetical protein